MFFVERRGINLTLMILGHDEMERTLDRFEVFGDCCRTSWNARSGSNAEEAGSVMVNGRKLTRIEVFRDCRCTSMPALQEATGR